jgi:hypothetical protein
MFRALSEQASTLPDLSRFLLSFFFFHDLLEAALTRVRSSAMSCSVFISNYLDVFLAACLFNYTIPRRCFLKSPTFRANNMSLIRQFSIARDHHSGLRLCKVVTDSER